MVDDVDGGWSLVVQIPLYTFAQTKIRWAMMENTPPSVILPLECLEWSGQYYTAKTLFPEIRLRRGTTGCGTSFSPGAGQLGDAET